MIEVEQNKFYIKSKRTGEPAFRKSFDTYGSAKTFMNKQIIKEYFEIDFNNSSDLVKKMLIEGLGQNDLVDLLKPEVSFDEYVSKNNNNNIVIAFFVLNEPLAVEPLENFCMKTPGVIDVDSSDSDTVPNASIVYVEFKRSESSREAIRGLIQDISKLSGIPLDDFSVRFPNSDEKYQYSEDVVDIYFAKMV